MALDTTVCAIKGCVSRHYAQGLCNKHYQRLRLTGTVFDAKPTLIERFHANFVRAGDDDCWNWTGGKSSNGYGEIYGDGKHWAAHRLSYVHFNGEIPEGMYILHSCDNKSCVNPRHIRTGTAKQNSTEAVERNLMLRGENHPKSKLTEENVAFIKAHPEMSHRALARMFSVWPNAIKAIRNGKSWKHA